jgi:hypothetical protein
MTKLRDYLLALALCLGAAQNSSGQSAELVTNGNFTQLTNDAGGQLGDNVNATGWTTTGYNFVFPSGNAGDVNVTGSDGALSLYGPANGSNNGLVVAPGGGNTVAADGAYEVAPIQQTINGLTTGTTYAVSFEWAGAQQSGFAGGTTENWSVSLGSATQTTNTVSIPNEGFSGWMTQTFDFTATGTTEVLSFLANGTPTGEPPFSLLADVSMTAVPEPKTYACWTILFGLGILFGKRAWRRFQN